MKPETRVRGDRPTVLLLGIWLGLERVNPVYHETIKVFCVLRGHRRSHSWGAANARTHQCRLRQATRIGTSTAPCTRHFRSDPGSTVAPCPPFCNVPAFRSHRRPPRSSIPILSALYLLILLAPFCSPLVDTVTFISASRVVF
ncbi:hypothetical protein B0H14DRAFT_3035034 [Mycena olivaceomarginata]|nr:hypothetical protein B0H14DRAFT_3035034 [Mycena olivaceomarginata]